MEKVLVMLNGCVGGGGGRHKQFRGSFYAVACSSSHIRGGGGAQKVSAP